MATAMFSSLKVRCPVAAKKAYKDTQNRESLPSSGGYSTASQSSQRNRPSPDSVEDFQ